ncbi:hypothetical protein [Anaerotignum propionicum]|uniref:DUF2007 domain-containing protein n=1 Tax=Anaerotignum propionicum DSM 1682 TaxID=991789 RepID=A0A0X8VAJ8_ANAPI|nr:hypothetical protein [Anaerotignum propionicum]AMJ42061.1 hypothetical protein CPRO_25130 [Anaerotignum propionicum DSM 1682]SHE50558.1 hypothetical protein SAMN02745151_00882 [[Clostridium] propionicum DSM 1682] [Anaerotignum propionicum DSM 1682]
MITIFNRKELFITYSLEKQAEIRNLLSAHKIEYTISTMGNTWQANSRGFDINTLAQIEYKIYVKKEDYEKAVFFLNADT